MQIRLNLEGFRTPILSALIIGASVSCSAQNEYEQRLEALVDDLQKNPLGHSQDYWLEIHNAYGEWEKVVLVFGYADDYSACESILLHARDTAPKKEYRCQAS